jgi:hypothetical protein
LLPLYFCGDFAWLATRPAELIFTESWAKDWPAGFSVFLGLAAGVGWLRLGWHASNLRRN